jgi:uncharacterized protein (UPF0335 family)
MTSRPELSEAAAALELLTKQLAALEEERREKAAAIVARADAAESQGAVFDAKTKRQVERLRRLSC